MNKLIKAIKEFRITKEEVKLKFIFLNIENNINKHLQSLTNYDVENLKSDIQFKIYTKAILNFEFRIADIEKKLKSKDYLDFKNKYVGYNDIYKEYELYIQEKQFINYINQIINNSVKDFFKKNKGPIIIPYEESIHGGNMDLFNIFKKNKEIIADRINYEDCLSYSEKEFLLNFIENDRILNSNEYSKKYGISIQAVNKRKAQIKEKILKR